MTTWESEYYSKPLRPPFRVINVTNDESEVKPWEPPVLNSVSIPRCCFEALDASGTVIRPHTHGDRDQEPVEIYNRDLEEAYQAGLARYLADRGCLA